MVETAERSGSHSPVKPISEAHFDKKPSNHIIRVQFWSWAWANLAYPRAHPLVFAVHVLVFALLLPICIPRAEVWPVQGRWQDFPIIATAYGSLRVIRLLLRCSTFTVCILSFARNYETVAGQERAFELAIETAFSSIWPTGGTVTVAMALYFLSRVLKIPRFLMEALVNEAHGSTGGFCAGLRIAQGVASRSYWMFGVLLGFQYFKDYTRGSGSDSPICCSKANGILEASGDDDHDKQGIGVDSRLHPRMVRMAHTDTFYHYAKLAFLAWVISSFAECYLLFHWEVGVADSSYELDAFRYTREFVGNYKPNFENWKFARVVVGNWREPFYCMMLYPQIVCLLIVGVVSVVVTTSSRSRIRGITTNFAMAIVEYIFLTSAHHLQFVILCLVVSWECQALQRKCEAFQENFGKLTSIGRMHHHEQLGKAMTSLGKRLHPMIVYLVVERVIHMAFDVMQFRCESAPLTLMHYMFRHLIRSCGVAMVIWRIGRLNASIYDDLTGKVQFELVSSHQRILEFSDPEEFRRYRWELKDWISYLQHNSQGSRKFCLRVCSFQCCLRAHIVAFWAVTVVLLPVFQKLAALLPGTGLF